MFCPKVLRRFAVLALVALAACAGLDHGGKPALVDHHVHVLSPQLVSEWKSIGVPFSKPDEHYVDVQTLIESARLEGALLVPMAHFYGNAEFRDALGLDLAEEEARVRHENDYVSALARRTPGCIALASVDLLRPYAERELDRARAELGTAGVKLHLRSAGFDPRDAEHVTALEGVVKRVAAADELLLLHLDVEREELESFEIEACLEAAFGEHPNVRVIVAHLGGSGGFGARTQLVLGACADWLAQEEARGNPRREFLLDVSAVPMLRESEGVPPTTPEELAALAVALRRIGLEHVCFGSDYPVFDPREQADALSRSLGLSLDELRLLFGNRAREFARPF